MKSILSFAVLCLAFLAPVMVAEAAGAPALEPLPESSWGSDWAGGCWFRADDSKGGQLLVLIHGEREPSYAQVAIGGAVRELPLSETRLQNNRPLRVGTRERRVYGKPPISLDVTTTVTFIPEAVCKGECDESIAVVARLTLRIEGRSKSYLLRNSACGL